MSSPPPPPSMNGLNHSGLPGGAGSPTSTKSPTGNPGLRWAGLAGPSHQRLREAALPSAGAQLWPLTPHSGHPDAERRMYRAAEGQLCPGHQQLPPPIPGISRALWPLHLLPVSQPHLQTAWPPACPYSHQWLGAPTKSPLGAATPEVSYKLGCLCIAHNTGPPGWSLVPLWVPPLNTPIPISLKV